MTNRKLHIGGQEMKEGWEILNVIGAPHVDHVCDAAKLPQFDDGCFAAIYASHIVEHFDYRYQLVKVLKEWHRVLMPGGKIYISVPDLDKLAWLFLSKDITTAERFIVMRMMFGGQKNEHDYHKSGINEEFLCSYLSDAGFNNIARVNRLGIFNDASNMIYKGVVISLNMIAKKPPVVTRSSGTLNVIHGSLGID